MARQRTGLAEHHAPRTIGCATPEFVVDEVAEAPEPQADRYPRREEIRRREKGLAGLAREIQHRQQHADETAVKGHAALPDFEHIERVREVVRQVVEQHVAERAAEYHAERAIEHEA